MSRFSVFQRGVVAPEKGGNWGLSTSLAGKQNYTPGVTAPELFKQFQETPGFQKGRTVEVEPLPFDRFENAKSKERKFVGGKNPVEQEAGSKTMTPPPLLAAKLKEQGYQNLVNKAYDDFGPRSFDPSPERLYAQLVAIETARRQSLDVELTREINGEIVDNFRQWLLKRGAREDHVRAGWWPTVKDHGKDVPDPNPPKFITSGGTLSDHPSVRAYLDSFVEARVAYERDLLMMRMEARNGDMQDWSIDKLWKYYKFGVLGLKPDAEFEALYDKTVPPSPEEIAKLPSALPPASSGAGPVPGDDPDPEPSQLDQMRQKVYQDMEATIAQQAEIQQQQLAQLEMQREQGLERDAAVARENERVKKFLEEQEAAVKREREAAQERLNLQQQQIAAQQQQIQQLTQMLKAMPIPAPPPSAEVVPPPAELPPPAQATVAPALPPPIRPEKRPNPSADPGAKRTVVAEPEPPLSIPSDVPRTFAPGVKPPEKEAPVEPFDPIVQLPENPPEPESAAIKRIGAEGEVPSGKKPTKHGDVPTLPPGTPETYAAGKPAPSPPKKEEPERFDPIQLPEEAKKEEAAKPPKKKGVSLELGNVPHPDPTIQAAHSDHVNQWLEKNFTADERAIIVNDPVLLRFVQGANLSIDATKHLVREAIGKAKGKRKK